MSEVGAGKAIEVLLLVAAGALVVWWQWRDVTRAQQASRAERERLQAEAARPERAGEPQDRP
jgi:hypothetical protein